MWDGRILSCNCSRRPRLSPRSARPQKLVLGQDVGSSCRALLTNVGKRNRGMVYHIIHGQQGHNLQGSQWTCSDDVVEVVFCHGIHYVSGFRGYLTCRKLSPHGSDGTKFTYGGLGGWPFRFMIDLSQYIPLLLGAVYAEHEPGDFQQSVGCFFEIGLLAMDVIKYW